MDKLIDKDLQELGHRLTEQELQQLGQQYLGISDFQQREARYASVIYPQLRDHYKTLPAADPPIEVLLVPVSGPHLPVLVAARWKPKRIYTIYSTLSIKYKPFIDQEIADLGLGISLSGDKPVKNIEFEPDRLYRAVKEALQP